MNCTRIGKIGSSPARAHEDGGVVLVWFRGGGDVLPGSAYLHQVRRAPHPRVALGTEGQPPVPKDSAGHGGRRARPELRRLPVERGAADGALRDWQLHRGLCRAVPHFVAPAADPLRHRRGCMALGDAIWQPHMFFFGRRAVEIEVRYPSSTRGRGKGPRLGARRASCRRRVR